MHHVPSSVQAQEFTKRCGRVIDGMRTGEPPEAAEPTLVIPDNPGGLFLPGRSILEGVCASVRGSYGENAIRGTGVTPPRGSQPASGPRQSKSRSFSVLVDSTGHAAHPLRGAQGAGAGVGIAHAMPLSCTPGGWMVDGCSLRAWFSSGMETTVTMLHETWLDPTTPSKVSTRAKSPRHLRYAT